MILRSRAVLFLVSCLTACLAAQLAFASETRVGEAVVFQNDVVRVAAEKTSPVNVGAACCATRWCAPATTARRAL
jgi:hypothetical protein